MKSLIKVLYISILCFFFMSCEKENVVTPFYLETTSAKVTENNVQLEGKSNYTASVTRRGFYISTSPDFRTNNKRYTAEKFKIDESISWYGFNHINSYNANTTVFRLQIKDLKSDTYYVKAYVKTNNGYEYGNVISFTIQ